MTVSVLIATRDRPRALRRCLASVARQDPRPFEVLVVDDASAEPLDEEALRALAGGLPLRCFRSEDRLGPIGCRNLLMRHADGDAFLVLDDDACLADTTAVARLVDALERHPDAGILAVRLIERVGDGERLLVPHGRRRPHQAERAGPVAHYLGGAHALRRSVVERCGAYPPDLAYGHEELDLSYRALDAGFTILYLPEVVVYHLPDPSGPSLTAWKLYHAVRNRLWVAYTYLPARYLAVHVGCWLVRYGLIAVRHGLLGAYGRGLRDGLAGMKHRARRRLQPRTVAYLKEHYGRLWC